MDTVGNRGPVPGRRIAAAGLPLAAALFAVGVLMGADENGAVFTVAVYLLAGAVALAVASRSSSAAARTVAWIAVLACWAPAAYLAPWDLTLPEVLPFPLNPASAAVSAVFAAAFLWAAWRAPRSDVDGIAGEAVTAVLVAWHLFLVVTLSALDYEGSDHPVVLAFLAAALLFVVGEYRARNREIAYGSLAWACLGYAVWVLSGDGIEGGIDEGWRPVLWWLCAVPVLAMLARLAWWRIRYASRNE